MAPTHAPLMIPILLGITGCVVVDTNPGPVLTSSKRIESGSAEVVQAELRMGAGDLTIGSGAKSLLESAFRYSERLGEPEIDYDVVRSKGRLTVESPAGRFSTGQTTNEWKLHFGDAVPIDLKIQVGAGKADVDLSALRIERVEIEIGAGHLELNLAGNYKQDVDVSVHGGVGQARVRLPRGFGAIADVAGGLGSISLEGLEQRGGKYVNRAYQEGKPAVHLSVRGGVGEIRLSVDQ